MSTRKPRSYALDTPNRRIFTRDSRNGCLFYERRRSSKSGQLISGWCIRRPIAAPSQNTPPPPPDRLHPGRASGDRLLSSHWRTRKTSRTRSTFLSAKDFGMQLNTAMLLCLFVSFRRSEGGACFYLKEFEAEDFQCVDLTLCMREEGGVKWF